MLVAALDLDTSRLFPDCGPRVGASLSHHCQTPKPTTPRTRIVNTIFPRVVIAKTIQPFDLLRILFQREPLRLDPTVLVVIGADRFFPAATNGIQARGIDAMPFDEKTFNFI